MPMASRSMADGGRKTELYGITFAILLSPSAIRHQYFVTG
jgi:hypothetical protein